MVQTKFPDLHKIPVPTPFPIGPANVYFLEGECPSLVDTGAAYEEGRRCLESALGELGYGLRDVRRIFLTHGHEDHFGLAGAIAEESDAEVCIHPADRPKVEDAVSGPPWGRDTERLDRVFRLCGVPADLFKIVERLVQSYRDTFRVEYRSLKNARTIDDNDQLILGSRTFRAVHCPGHSPGTMCLLDEADAILFSGDHVLKSVTTNPTLEIADDETDERFQSLANYTDSLRKLKDLPINVAFPGHGEDMQDVWDTIEGLLEHHEGRKDRIVDILTRRPPSTVYQVSRFLFKRLEPYEIPLAISETVAHLDVLEMEKRVQFEVQDGLPYYTARVP